MKYKFLIFFTIIFSLSAKSPCKGQDKNDWIEDIKYFSEKLPENHKDFYKLIDSAEFKTQINLLVSKVDTLDDITIILELQRILASLKVSHTIIPAILHPKFLYNLPISLEIFDDGLFITGIDKTKEENIAKRVVSINDVPVKEIYNKLEPLISYENEYWLKRQIPDLIIKPQILDYIKITDKSNLVCFQLDNNEKVEFPIEKSKVEMAYCQKWAELTLLKNQNKTYWFEVISNNILYIQYNKCQDDKTYPFDTFVEDIATTINKNQINKIVVDLRLNSGGNSAIINPLVQKLQEYKDKDIFVPISKRTWSSGRYAVRDLKSQLNAILIGEPTGGSPNSYGYNKTMFLPNSELPVNYCVEYFTLMDTDKDYFEPDIKIAYNAKDLLNGKDLVLDYIIER